MEVSNFFRSEDGGFYARSHADSKALKAVDADPDLDLEKLKELKQVIKLCTPESKDGDSDDSDDDTSNGISSKKFAKLLLKEFILKLSN